MLYDSIENIEAGLQKFPPAVLQEFRSTAPAVQRRLSSADFYLWGKEGIALAEHSFRSWEATVEYFRATLVVLRQLDFSHLSPWTQGGKALAQESSALACAFFRASAETLHHLSPDRLVDWALLGRSLYKGTWRSSSLACRLFDLSPQLLIQVSLDEMKKLSLFLDRLANRSYDLALEALNLAPGVLAELEKGDRDALYELACLLAEITPRDAKLCFEVAPKALNRICRDERRHFLSLVALVAQSGAQESIPFLFFHEGARSLGTLDWALHPKLLSLAEELVVDSPLAGLEFLKNCPAVLARVRSSDLEPWLREGQILLRDSPEAGVDYFRLEARRSLEVIERLASSMELSRVSDVLQMYCCALTGRSILILPTMKLTEKNLGWASPDSPTTEGNAIFLPPVINRYPHKDENFRWAKVAATHQTGHIELGTFDFSFDRPAHHFPDLRPSLEPKEAAGEKSITDFQRFFNFFPERKLASETFTVVEDSRIDHQVKEEYKGIKPLYEGIQRDSLEARPDIITLPLREAILENLVRISLGQTRGLAVSNGLQSIMKRAVHLQAQSRSPGATVEDSAEATIRLYRLLVSIPNIVAPSEAWQDMDLDALLDAETLEDMGDQNPAEPPLDREAHALEFTPPQTVEFRGELKPELVQILSRLERERTQISAPALQEAMDNSTEPQLKDKDLERPRDQLISNLVKEAARRERASSSQKRNGLDPSQESLERDDVLSFLYDEWDFRAGDFKPRWCRVEQKVMEEGSADFFERTLREYHHLAIQVKKQFELINPEFQRKMKKLPDGEEYELDAVIEAMVDRRAGQTPSEKIYWRRNKIERDVAVAFLLDMSASTAEAVSEMDIYSSQWLSRAEPPLYHALPGSRPIDKRIIDVEKESAVLFIQALETIGDTYSIYGFSGYSRENVEFYIIKDLGEPFSEQVKRRLDKIAPLQATRMGPAIRHATAKLDVQEAKTKILFLLSDGRPQDHGYSRDGVEKDYAVHDTRMALVEARRKGIVPFCLTVDRAGHDYLKTMCSDMGYEIVDDIHTLPKRLPALYRRLTT
ncbi:MAG: VWA domain-containing protein [Chloroflexi bacterium]|nr:VWA domain-containing protein [Chloroflexota bacterium]